MKYTLKICTAVLITATLFSFTTITEPPKDWFTWGTKVSSYEMKADHSVFKTGSSSATIQSIDKKIKGFGTLMQTCSAKKFLNKKVKFTAYVKADKVKGWAGLWLRIDGKGQGRSLNFDNMQDRAIKGTSDWKKYEIILDVPEEASTLNYGALLAGTGKIWFDNVTMEAVGPATPTTGKIELAEPANLNFEE